VFAFTLDPLYAPIDTAQSKVVVLSTKVEIVLRKQTAGQKWNTLEASSTNVTLTDRSTAVSEAATSGSSTSTKPSGPAYPTSSRHGVKNWDKLASDLTSKKKEKKKDKTKDKGTDSDKKDDTEDAGAASDAESVDSDYASSDPVDAFFKKLYANADPDTRRAMVKSYYESDGTALSTNWDEVGKGKVAVRPPSND
jgi:suppressor of G2 allele of SKP1